jgi:hypothetical protein
VKRMRTYPRCCLQEKVTLTLSNAHSEGQNGVCRDMRKMLKQLNNLICLILRKQASLFISVVPVVGVIGVTGSGILKSRTSRVVSEMIGSLASVKLAETMTSRIGSSSAFVSLTITTNHSLTRIGPVEKNVMNGKSKIVKVFFMHFVLLQIA